MSETHESIAPYTASALQIACKSVLGCPDPESAAKVRMASLERIAAYVTTNVQFVQFHNGSTVRLVVLPEYFLTGFCLGDSHDLWRAKAAVDYDGREYEVLGALAQKNNIYLVTLVKVDQHFFSIPYLRVLQRLLRSYS